MSDLSHDIAVLFKKWFVIRPGGMCQVLFPLTELDAFVEEIMAVANKHKSSQLAEARREIEQLHELIGYYLVMESAFAQAAPQVHKLWKRHNELRAAEER